MELRIALSQLPSFRNDSRYIYPPPNRPFLVVEGFQFCRSLNRATFFTDIPVDFPSGPSPLTRKNIPEFTSLIDYTARKLLERRDRREYQREVRVTHYYRDDFAARGMCFSLVQGFHEGGGDFPSLQWGQKWNAYPSQGRLLRSVDGQIIFPFLNFDGVDKVPLPPALIRHQKQHFKIAYVVMIHNNVENVASLLDALLDNDDEGDVFVYLHVDYGKDFWLTYGFFKEIQRLARERKNVKVMETRFPISRGHISILWAQLRAFFDLLDMITFDYVVNLSGSDYPLKKGKVIWEHLERRSGGNWIYWNDGGWQADQRLDRMYHCLGKEGDLSCALDQNPREYRSWSGMSDLFRNRYKGSPWLILHYSAVEYLRTSSRTKLLLIWSEHTLCPDEMFFPIFFAASPFVNKTYRDPKRLMRRDERLQLMDWTVGDRWDIEYWQKYFCWIRKVDVVKDKELKELLDAIREKGEMWEGAVADFKWGAVPQ
jgi:Core-2/I-Branching enzyme